MKTSRKLPPAPCILIASGASGGHLIPALAVADELKSRGFKITVVLGGNKFSELVTQRGYPLVQLPASGFNVRNPFRKFIALARLGFGLIKALMLVLKTKPVVVFGTGGYATVATMLAAKAVGIPCVCHEQNVLPGRANRLLSRFVDVMVLSFAASKKYFPPKTETIITGMPLRTEVLAARKLKRKTGKGFHLLITGGSQGSHLINEVVPAMLALMPGLERKGITVTHQARPEDTATVKAAYKQLKITAEVKHYFNDMPAQTRAAHLVIGRSGASTVMENATLGRAAIYVPLVLADGHQIYNAQVAESAGAAVVLLQPLFTPAALLMHVRAIRKSPSRLAAMEQAALTLTEAHGAAARVAAVVQAAIGNNLLTLSNSPKRKMHS